jgi:hypothetical protein
LRPETVRDLDGDQQVDVLYLPAMYAHPTRAVVGYGHGAGTFDAEVSFAVSGPTDQIVADVNGDGRPDIVTTGSLGFDVLLNTCY